MTQMSNTNRSRPRPVTVDEVVPKAEQSRRTRKLIIETGINCIARYGYSQTSMQLISKEANISRGPLHYHFKDKNDLMGSIAEALPKKVSASTLARFGKAKTLRDRIEVLIDIALEQHLGDHHFVAIELLTAARHDPELARYVLPHFFEGEKFIDLWWNNYGTELDWSEQKMRAFRTVFVASLRGLAIDYSVTLDEQHYRRAASLLKEMLLGYACTPKATARKS
jgi:AcrR family transcriptional regulator